MLTAIPYEPAYNMDAGTNVSSKFYEMWYKCYFITNKNCIHKYCVQNWKSEILKILNIHDSCWYDIEIEMNVMALQVKELIIEFNSIVHP